MEESDSKEIMLLLISITRERFLVKKLKNKIPSIFFFYTSSGTGIFRFLFDRIFPSAKKFLLFFISKFFLIASHDCILSSFFNFSARKYSYGKYNTQYESILRSISIVKSKQNKIPLLRYYNDINTPHSFPSPSEFVIVESNRQ